MLATLWAYGKVPESGIGGSLPRCSLFVPRMNSRLSFGCGTQRRPRRPWCEYGSTARTTRRRDRAPSAPHRRSESSRWRARPAPRAKNEGTRRGPREVAPGGYGAAAGRSSPVRNRARVAPDSGQHPRAGRPPLRNRLRGSRQPTVVGLLRPDFGGTEALGDERHGSP